MITIAIVLILHFWPHAYPGPDANATLKEVTPRGDLADDEKSTIAVFNKASPAVVHITTLRNYSRGLFDLNVQQIPEGTGSGVVWDKDGRIVTNYHVIRNADGAKVTLADRSSWDGKLIGDYPDKDLAVLTITPRRNACFPLQSAPRMTCRSARGLLPSATPSAWTRPSPRRCQCALSAEKSVRHQPAHQRT